MNRGFGLVLLLVLGALTLIGCGGPTEPAPLSAEEEQQLQQQLEQARGGEGAPPSAGQ